MQYKNCKLGVAVIHSAGVEGIVVSQPKKCRGLYCVDVIVTDGFRGMAFLENLEIKQR